jgi:acetyl-CoA acyltransferase 1
MLLPRTLNAFVRAPTHFSRAASTSARGVTALLQKNPEDVVITFAKRTAMGKAKKGQLKDTPVDELLHALFKVRRLGHSKHTHTH